jgi:hypothetical protein
MNEGEVRRRMRGRQVIWIISSQRVGDILLNNMEERIIYSKKLKEEQNIF